MADQAEEHCTVHHTMLRARITATPVKAEKDRDFVSVRYCSSPVAGKILCSRSAGSDIASSPGPPLRTGDEARSDSANDRQQFRFTCVSANAISDTRHGWQPPVSTASCRL